MVRIFLCIKYYEELFYSYFDGNIIPIYTGFYFFFFFVQVSIFFSFSENESKKHSESRYSDYEDSDGESSSRYYRNQSNGHITRSDRHDDKNRHSGHNDDYESKLHSHRHSHSRDNLDTGKVTFIIYRILG